MPEQNSISIPILPEKATPLPVLTGMTLEEMTAFMAGLDEPGYRARQLYAWIYARRADRFETMTSFGKELRARLHQSARLRSLQLLDTQTSEDGTIKFLWRTHDGYNIESVLIPSEARDDQDEPKRRTICISTQVGCPLDCKFCATASMRLKRSLSAGEIVEQFVGVEREAGERITNIVFMGMGEPMLNYDQVFRAVSIFTDPDNELAAARHITVSTSGLPEGIRRMADEGQRIKLAVSLHALTNGMRSELMPINRRYDIAQVMEAVEYYYRRTRQPVTYEYILFDGWNDTDADVRRLARITRRVPSKVNVIPFHEIEFTNPTGISARLRSTPREKFDLFIRKLRDAGVTVMVRSSSGEDIDAACGQLAIKHGATALHDPAGSIAAP
ncbi:MAG: 23S rRNA (adenine(2503)-C(2))-methyltransferase RlmN [Bacteroidetes bacterium]|nr:23S rRNA (adenine(2503)-C(2))-methyltransferase RlmN [Bacteroidota bacterium]